MDRCALLSKHTKKNQLRHILIESFHTSKKKKKTSQWKQVSTSRSSLPSPPFELNYNPYYWMWINEQPTSAQLEKTRGEWTTGGWKGQVRRVTQVCRTLIGAPVLSHFNTMYPFKTTWCVFGLLDKKLATEKKKKNQSFACKAKRGRFLWSRD